MDLNRRNVDVERLHFSFVEASTDMIFLLRTFHYVSEAQSFTVSFMNIFNIFQHVVLMSGRTQEDGGMEGGCWKISVMESDRLQVAGVKVYSEALKLHVF